jgi:chromosome segregation ATPase
MSLPGAGVQLVDVKKAIDNLKEQGVKPTAEAIRKCIGRGSILTIHTFKKELERQAIALSQDTVTELKPILEKVGTIITQQVNEGTADLRDRESELEAEIYSCKIEWDKLIRKKQDLETELEAKRADCNMLEAEIKEAKEQYTAIKKEKEDLIAGLNLIKEYIKQIRDDRLLSLFEIFG